MSAGQYVTAKNTDDHHDNANKSHGSPQSTIRHSCVGTQPLVPSSGLKPVHVFFFRGLSTYGNDHAKWSVFDFGPISKHLVRSLGAREVVLHPVLGMGSGTLVEVA